MREGAAQLCLADLAQSPVCTSAGDLAHLQYISSLQEIWHISSLQDLAHLQSAGDPAHPAGQEIRHISSLRRSGTSPVCRRSGTSPVRRRSGTCAGNQDPAHLWKIWAAEKPKSDTSRGSVFVGSRCVEKKNNQHIYLCFQGSNASRPREY